MTIEADTVLLPDVIAGVVVGEAANHTNSCEPYKYANELIEKAQRTYARNAIFNKKIRGPGDRGRDYLYMFMRHWLAALLKSQHPRLYEKLPRQFSNGVG